jgi:hypothetical protein
MDWIDCLKSQPLLPMNNKMAWKPAKFGRYGQLCTMGVNHDEVILKMTLSLACLSVLWNNWDEFIQKKKHQFWRREMEEHKE